VAEVLIVSELILNGKRPKPYTVTSEACSSWGTVCSCGRTAAVAAAGRCLLVGSVSMAGTSETERMLIQLLCYTAREREIGHRVQLTSIFIPFVLFNTD
jgi:hypothetical protein